MFLCVRRSRPPDDLERHPLALGFAAPPVDKPLPQREARRQVVVPDGGLHVEEGEPPGGECDVPHGGLHHEGEPLPPGGECDVPHSGLHEGEPPGGKCEDEHHVRRGGSEHQSFAGPPRGPIRRVF